MCWLKKEHTSNFTTTGAYFSPQFLALHLVGVLFKDGECRLKDTIDDVEVPCLEFGHHLRNEPRPLIRKVVLADDGDGLRQLLLDGLGAAEHKVHHMSLDGVTVAAVDPVTSVLVLSMKINHTRFLIPMR